MMLRKSSVSSLEPGACGVLHQSTWGKLDENGADLCLEHSHSILEHKKK